MCIRDRNIGTVSPLSSGSSPARTKPCNGCSRGASNTRSESAHGGVDSACRPPSSTAWETMPVKEPFPLPLGQSRMRCSRLPQPWHAIGVPSRPFGFPRRPKPLPDVWALDPLPLRERRAWISSDVYMKEPPFPLRPRWPPLKGLPLSLLVPPFSPATALSEGTLEYLSEFADGPAGVPAPLPLSVTITPVNMVGGFFFRWTWRRFQVPGAPPSRSLTM